MTREPGVARIRALLHEAAETAQQIRELERHRREIAVRLTELVGRALGRAVVLGGMPCPDSVTGRCVYAANDVCRDDCLFCGEPAERK